MDTVIKVENISCGYDQRPVLKNLNFSLGGGEMLGIMGPNGSGKSTLIRALTGILQLSKGRIKLYGKAIEEYSVREIAQQIAVIPQQTPITFSFSSLDLVLMGRTPYLRRFQGESSKDLEIALEAMQRTDSISFRDRPIHELSGGERQRVIIARALAQQPSILLLDEPTSFLDLNHQVEIFDLLRRLCDNDGLTVLCVSHDLNLSSEYCSRLIMLKNGYTYVEGTPEMILTHEHIKAVFETDVTIIKSPYSGAPQVILKPNS